MKKKSCKDHSQGTEQWNKWDFKKRDRTLNMCSKHISVCITLILRFFSYLFMAKNCFHKRDVYRSPQPAGIDHSQTASGKWWLPGAKGFFFLSSLSMSDKQQQSTSMGTKPQRWGGAAWLSTVSFKEILQLTFSAAAPLGWMEAQPFWPLDH